MRADHPTPPVDLLPPRMVTPRGLTVRVRRRCRLAQDINTDLAQALLSAAGGKATVMERVRTEHPDVP